MSVSSKYMVKTDDPFEDVLELLGNRRAFLMIDKNVFKYNEDLFTRVLKDPRIVGCYHDIGGESDKTFDNAQIILTKMLSLSLNRDDLLIGIGGGVVTDLSGFVASLYKRGMPWIACPTTLLGMIDAAIGGKTAVNTSHGKNLIGTFHEPEMIYYHYDFLKTLPEKEWRNGLGELQKYGMIYDKSLFEFVQVEGENWQNKIVNVIETCIKYKLQIVNSDLKESELRMVLNFGHTFGHCLEKEFNFRKYGHGESVMYGILIALSLSTVIVGLEKRVYTDYLHWMKSQKWFDQEVYLHQEWFTNGLTQDKKIRGNLLKIILIKGYGKPCIHSIEESELIALLERSFYEINQDLI